MAEGAAISEGATESALLQKPRFSLVQLDEDTAEKTPTTRLEGDLRGSSDHHHHPLEPQSDEEDDLLVYSEAAASLHKANDISHQFTSHKNEQLERSEKSEIPQERHEIKLDGGSENGGRQRETTDAPQRLFSSQDDAATSFQEVPLLHSSHPDGIFFNGLVFCDTVDSLYRPVVVINTRAIPHKSLRAAALKHLREALEPVVSTGPYVLIFTSFASSTLTSLPVSWVLAAYRELSHPFKKNVQHVILVRPNKLLKALVKIMKVVVKKKAHAKIKQILYLGDIETVTNGEVTLEHLSPKVIRALGAEELTYSDLSASI